MPRRALLGLVSLGAACCLALPASAAARDDTVTEAVVNMRLAPNAALLVEENLTFDYDGRIPGVLPRHPGARVRADRQRRRLRGRNGLQAGRLHRPSGAPTWRTYGVGPNPNEPGIRIVWHHKASDENPHVHRPLPRARRAWWPTTTSSTSSGRSGATSGRTSSTTSRRPSPTPPSNPAEATPDKPSGVWGHPRDVEGRDFLESGEARLEADDIHAGQFVEMRVVMPREPGQNVERCPGRIRRRPRGILDEEGDNDDDFNSALNKAKRFIANNADPAVAR